MRLILCFIFALLLACPAFAAEGGAPVFRGFVWGVTKDDVRKYEKARFYREEGDMLQFLEKPDQFRRLITYRFTDGGLSAAKYESVELHEPNPQRILGRSFDLSAELRDIYGPPSGERAVWKNKTYRNRPDFWYRPLQSGDLRLESEWTIPDGRVVMETYHDGLYYQLYYTVEKAKAKADPARGLFDLAPQDTKSPR